MGIVDVVSEYCSLPRTRRHIKKRKQFQVPTIISGTSYLDVAVID
jgi:hypothetical protein